VDLNKDVLSVLIFRDALRSAKFKHFHARKCPVDILLDWCSARALTALTLAKAARA